MIQKNKNKLLFTSAVVLLPILIGLVLWNQLPDSMPIHGGIDGNPDRWSSKGVVVFGLPLLLLVLHWVSVLFAGREMERQKQNEKVKEITFWVAPALSLILGGMGYAQAMELEMSVMRVLPVLMGVPFLLIGNYMPKCQRNRTIGIRVKWTLLSEENWNRTHRLGGKIWVAGGLLLLLCTVLPEKLLLVSMLLILLVLTVAPILYSYLYFRKQVAEGSVNADEKLPRSIWDKIVLGVVVGALLLVAILLNSGNVTIQYDAESFTVKSNHWQEKLVEYNLVEKIVYRESDDRGERVNGFENWKVLLGNFRNEEFGDYLRYSYAKCDSCVVVQLKKQTLVLSGKDDAATYELYEKLIHELTLG